MPNALTMNPLSTSYSNTSTLSGKVSAEGIPPHMFNYMEGVSQKVLPQVFEAGRELVEPASGKQTVSPLSNLPLAPKQQEALEAAIDGIWEVTEGRPSMMRRLQALLARVRQASETHVYQKRDEAHTRKTKIEDETLGSLQSAKGWKAIFTGGGGISGAALAFVAPFLPGGAGDALKALAPMMPQFGQAGGTITDRWEIPGNYELQDHLQMQSSRKQEEQGILQLNEKLSQHLMELMRIVSQMSKDSSRSH